MGTRREAAPPRIAPSLVRRSFDRDESIATRIGDFVKEQTSRSRRSQESAAQVAEMIAQAVTAARSRAPSSVIEVKLRITNRQVDVEFSKAPGRGSGEAQAAPETFAQWFAGLLRAGRTSQEAAARRIGVSLKTVNRWVHGETEPRLRELRMIREAFGEVPPLT
jgi:hypothetical protein